VKAIVYSEYGGTPVLTRVADPACPADEVVGPPEPFACRAR
jgi:hypothetical protein